MMAASNYSKYSSDHMKNQRLLNNFENIIDDLLWGGGVFFLNPIKTKKM